MKFTIEKTGPEHIEISDGYHTFDELYSHRHALYIAFLKLASERFGHLIWKARTPEMPGWFLLGVGLAKGEQITYHLPQHLWYVCTFAQVMDPRPEFDKHTSEDVVARIWSQWINP